MNCGLAALFVWLLCGFGVRACVGSVSGTNGLRDGCLFESREPGCLSFLLTLSVLPAIVVDHNEVFSLAIIYRTDRILPEPSEHDVTHRTLNHSIAGDRLNNKQTKCHSYAV